MEGAGGGGGGVEGKHCICWLMKDGIRNCPILVLGILGVSVQVLGMNSRHYYFRSLMYITVSFICQQADLKLLRERNTDFHGYVFTAIIEQNLK